ncbi:MAG: acetate kinase [Bacilli bacterium]|nr:acetate kinase [Bacilli bacterium]
MKILSVNAGSSSLKFTAFEMPEEKKLISGYFQRIGIDKSFYTLKVNGNKKEVEAKMNNHSDAFKILIEELINNHIVSDMSEIKAIGHRVVHGGEYFKESTVIDDSVIEKIEKLKDLAPLHNPAAIVGIRAAIDVVPNATEVAVFDTSFHQTMERETYLYALPMNWYRDYKVRKYGAHGTSHKYITERMESVLGKKDTKLIICHIGSGASISAVKNGKCINTSMGFTPNAGLIMGTRCGDIDASIIPYMMKQANISPDEIDKIMNKESGVLAISEQFSDMRDIYDNVKLGEEKSILALNMFVRRIVDYIAKYYFELKGCDAIIFTAGVGENGAFERKKIVEQLEFLGVHLNAEFNEQIASYHDIHEGKITTDDSTIPVFVIPTDEELMIARDTFNFTK